MIKKPINQNDSNDLELLNSIGYEYIFDNKPINRLKNKFVTQDLNQKSKLEKLNDLKKMINSIENCKLKEKAKQIIFGDGNINSPLMIVGGAPSEAEDSSGATFFGEDGILLKKMLIAININKDNIYSTYAINFKTPLDRKPNVEEITRYNTFLQKHISIINPKLIILFGSTAMESLMGCNNKISFERGKWKEIIINNTTYNTLITFDPSYLIRFPENKKHSWEDLKKIKQKIVDLNINI